MIKGTIFDVDGTILNSMEIWENAGELYLNRMGMQAAPGLGRELFYMSMEEGAAYLKQNYKLDDGIDEIINGINTVIRNFYFYDAQLKKGVTEYLQGLRMQDVPITAATATDRPLIEAAFSRLGIDVYFDKIFTCSEVGKGKQEPDIYHRAAAWMGSSPAETLVFEDALHAIYTSAESGYKTIGVYDPSSQEEQEKIKNKVCIYLKEYIDFDTFWKKASDI